MPNWPGFCLIPDKCKWEFGWFLTWNRPEAQKVVFRSDAGATTLECPVSAIYAPSSGYSPSSRPEQHNAADALNVAAVIIISHIHSELDGPKVGNATMAKAS